MRLRNTTGAAGSLALGLAVMLSLAAPAGAASPQLGLKGQATFCLTTDAASALKSDGLILTATVPATMSTSGPTPCITTPMEDDVEGSTPIQGGFTFTKDSNKLDFTDLNNNLLSGMIQATASVNGDALSTIDMVKVGILGVDTKNKPATLTRQASNVFVQVFNVTPVNVGQALFTVSSTADLPS